MIEAYPLYWPDGRPRTKSPVWSRFKTTFGAARDGLMEELQRLGATKIVLSTNIKLRFDGLPLASEKEPRDAGVAVYFEYKKRPMCFACDKYGYVRENIQAISKTIEAVRGIERWGSSDMMERAFRGFTALPETASEPWRNVFGFTASEAVTSDQIDEAFRKLAFTEHPDHGGTSVRFQRIINARTDARRAIGETA